MSFLEELKRRNVIRVGLAYLLGSWIAIQVSETLFPVYGLSDAAIRLVVTALAVGLLPVLVLAWVFERTPEGIKRESKVDRSASITNVTGKSLDRWIIVALVLALSYFVFDKFISQPSDPGAVQVSDERSPALDDWNSRDIAQNRRSIAVLPFTNMSGDKANEPFTLGIHDDLLTHLSRIKSLKTTSRTSVLQYRETRKSVPEIGAELGVGYILEGGIQRAGDRVRINLQLIDVATDEHLWAEIYDRELTVENLFSVQADIAGEVTRSLQATLLPDEQKALDVQPTRSMAAYDLYLLGRHHQETRSEESLNRAVGYFSQAIEEDPGYVLAYAGLAQSRLLLTGYGNLRGRDVLPETREIIDQAMALDDTESSVWAAQGLYYLHTEENPEAISALERAIELDIQNYYAWLWYANALLGARRYVEHLEALQVGYSLEPMSYPVNVNLASAYHVRGDFVQARQHYERTDQVDPEDQTQWIEQIVDTYYRAGELTRAVVNARQLLSSDPSNVDAMELLVDSYIELGNFAEARRWIEEVARLDGLNPTATWLYLVERDFDGAIAYLEDKRMMLQAQHTEFIPELFEVAYLGGRIETARDYLNRYLGSMGGRMEVNPAGNWQWYGLLVADFLIRHGEESPGGEGRGRQMLLEILSGLEALNAKGFEHPYTWAGLAMARAMSGETQAALVALDQAVQSGFVINSHLQLLPQFDSIRDEPGFQALVDSVDSKLALERASLAEARLAEFTPMTVRERVVVAPDVLQDYLGYYTDGNIRFQFFLGDDGQVYGRPANQMAFPMVPYSETQFYVEMMQGLTIEFVRDDAGQISHMQVNQSGTVSRMKVTDPPPESITLAPEAMQSIVGSWSALRVEGASDSPADTDIWTAVITVDEDGQASIDFDDQPVLALEPFSENEFHTPGFIGSVRFESSSNDGHYDRMVMLTDGVNLVFNRDETATE